ncbi:MOSC domain-containing protein [Mesorhizobium sp. CAU 1732]|uniref:MOSC domain-containing protein n=1 Tax=Mesorhizobium sp. CAU 1732 TaxID=3140358 RepID=UPI0032614803
MTVFGRVAELWRYPVSSMGGEKLETAELGKGGIFGDRVWGLVDMRDGEVAAPEKRRHWRPVPNILSRLGEQGPEIGTGGDGWIGAGTPQADALASAFLDLPVALKPHTPYETEQESHVAPRYGRADLHILTSASMERLGELLGDPSEIDSRRFRPNIVIETAAGFTGFAEQELVGSKLAIGDVMIAIAEPCSRCSFTALAQGELAFEPAVLHKIAQHGDGGFGVLCAVETGGVVRLGDDVRIVQG